MYEPKSNTEASTFFVSSFDTSVGDKLSIFNGEIQEGQSVITTRVSESLLGTYERYLSWSPTLDLLAYNRSLKSDVQYADILSLDTWEIIIADPAGGNVLHTIAGGHSPAWIGTTDMLAYLKADGVYTFNIKTKVEQKILSAPNEGRVTSLSMIAVSPDGSKLLWTFAKAGVITLYEIGSEAQSPKAIGRIEKNGTEFYWPIFSPEGSFFAVQAIDQLNGNELFRKNQRIEVRSVTDVTPIATQSLIGFNFDELFTDAWIQ
jgi:hypothetical protein